MKKTADDGEEETAAHLEQISELSESVRNKEGELESL